MRLTNKYLSHRTSREIVHGKGPTQWLVLSKWQLILLGYVGVADRLTSGEEKVLWLSLRIEQKGACEKAAEYSFHLDLLGLQYAG